MGMERKGHFMGKGYGLELPLPILDLMLFCPWTPSVQEWLAV